MHTAPSFYYYKRLLGGLHMKEAFITKVACSKNDRHSDTERKNRMDQKRNYRRFLLLWAGELVSSVGSGLTSFGLRE